MKIEVIGSQQLKLVIKQRFLQCIGLLFIFIAIILTLSSLINYQIICKQKDLNQANNCFLHNSIFNIYHSNTPLGELKSAEVRSHSGGRNNNKIMYYLYFVTNNGTVRMTSSESTSSGNYYAAAQAINNYISTSRELSFIVPYNTDWSLYFVILPFLLCGVWMLSFKNANVIVDKSIQKVRITCKSLFSRRENNYPFSNIEKIIVEKQVYSTTMNKKDYYRLALLLKNKEIIPFTTNFTSSFEVKETIAKQLNEFMDK